MTGSTHRTLVALAALLMMVVAVLAPVVVAAPSAGAVTIQKQCAKTAVPGVSGITFEACVWNDVGSHLVYGSVNTYVNGQGLYWLALHGNGLNSRYQLCSPSEDGRCVPGPEGRGWNCTWYVSQGGKHVCTAKPGIRYRGNSGSDQTWRVYGGWSLFVGSGSTHVWTKAIRTTT